MNDEKQTFYHPDTDSYETASKPGGTEGTDSSGGSRGGKIYHAIDRKITASRTEAPKL